jgi:hypothetical protein
MAEQAETGECARGPGSPTHRTSTSRSTPGSPMSVASSGTLGAGSGAGVGCPVLMQTGPSIKVVAVVNLPALVHFIEAHFDDIPLLKSFLEKCESSHALLVDQ